MTGTRSSGTEQLSGNTGDRLAPVRVTAIDGPGKGAAARLEAGTIRIGSDPSCDLVLPDRSVSRVHLTAELLRGAVRVRDAGSRNGTLFLGAKIAEARIPIGGTVKVGRTTLRFSPATSGLEPSERDELGGLIGGSVPMRQLFAQLERLGPQSTTVLVQGETGTGKEAIARALHALSPGAAGPFLVFDCASVNPNLIESELFGHAKGAFSGAERARPGALESASGGTLFLDEVGELPLELQPKLLRALESREFKRVGDNAVRRASARFIAATHRDLAAEAKAGRFRLDLYYRLAVATVRAPPLRERPEDIAPLAAHFARQAHGAEFSLSATTLAMLQADPWHGNVRELRNAVERALALGSPSETAASSRAEPAFKEARAEVLHRFERDYLAGLLAKHKDNVSAAARAAKLSRTQFYRLLQRHGLM
ncbi:MAG: sigma 54-dependent Fis family transcriptional regulator [Myxococcales bacterium]|nr:sigma 54-dependent Fis family transcriptional regulator [Myxococcales bacterium]